VNVCVLTANLFLIVALVELKAWFWKLTTENWFSLTLLTLVRAMRCPSWQMVLRPIK